MEERSPCHLMCRICLSEKHDDFECIFEVKTEDSNPVISELGAMYQNLFNLPITYHEREPRHLCNYCALQTKLLYKLKSKAFISFEWFRKSIIKEEKQINDDKERNESKKQSSSNLNVVSDSNKIIIIDLPIIKNDDHVQQLVTDTEEDSPEVLKKVKIYDNNSIRLEKESGDNDNNQVIDLDDSDWEEEFLSDEYNENDCSPEHYTFEIEKASGKDETSTSVDGTVTDEDNDYYEFENDSKKVQEKSNLKSITQCYHCLEIFDSKKNLRIHCKEQHSRKKLTCITCAKIVHSEEALQVHKNIHSGLPAYKCDECDKTFKQKCHYAYHKAHHRNERKEICNVCNKGFLSKGDLKIHMRSHLDERRYSCDICGKSFRVSTHMKNHRFTHFEKQFECSTCFQMYVTPATLNTHIKTVHLNVTAYQCEICEKRFKRKHHLVAHYKVHKKSVFNNERNDKLKSLISNFSED